MSGGSYDYAYAKIEGMADSLSIPGHGPSAALRRAFRAHLYKVAEAARAIEWNDSCDGADNEAELIRACVDRREIAAESVTALLRAIAEAQEALRLLEGAK